MQLKTGAWFAPLPDDHIRIGISRGVPRFGQIGKGYRRYTPLQPGPWLTSRDFTELYLEQLSHLNPEKVLEDLTRIAGDKVGVLKPVSGGENDAPLRGPPGRHRGAPSRRAPGPSAAGRAGWSSR
jgi:hypothetical protein